MAQKKDVRELIRSEAMQNQFALALPKHLSPERFARIALTTINKNPKLAQCTQASLMSCLLDLSQLGLEPDGRKAHLIPYGDKCTLVVDYKGLVELARRSGEIADIHADIVRENDFFEFSFGSNSKLVHKPAIKDRGEPVAGYSFVRLKDGSSSFEVMNIEEIEAVHQRSKAKDAGPWITDWPEMAKKTVFRRHWKWLPFASEFSEALDKDYDVPVDIIRTMKPAVEMPKAIGELVENGQEETQEEPKPENKEPKQKEKTQTIRRISKDQLDAIRTLAENNGYDIGQLNNWLVKKYNIIGGASMIPAEGKIYDQICSDIVGEKLPGRFDYLPSRQFRPQVDK
jgi:recombination protein RecT